MNKRITCLPITILFALCALITAYAQPELDITFNGNGRVTGEFAVIQSTLNEVLVQADNKIVTVGILNTPSVESYFALTRHNEDGSLDLTFGDQGHVFTDFNPNAAGEGANAAVIQPDGKIIAAGYVRVINPGEAYFALARYNTDGSLDQTFGSGGLVQSGNSHTINEANAVALAPDGKIAAAGYYFDGIRFQVMVTVYSSTGTPLWTGVDNRGFALGDSNRASAVVFQTDGKVMVAGFTANSSENGISFVRFNTDGSKDNTFGFLGRLFVSNTQSEAINDLTVLPDGRIISVGRLGSDMMVRRMFGNGMHDISFSDDGRAVASFGSTSVGNSLMIRPDGKILAAGYGSQNFSLAMFNTNGTLDTSFSDDGKLTFDFPGFSSSVAYSMALDSLGRIVLGGNVTNKYAIARLYTLDPVPVTVSGQARTPDGTPIRNLRIGLTDASGVTRWSITSNFGFFNFDAVLAGQTCNLFVRGSKTHIFESRDIGLNQAANVDLIGTPRTEKQSVVKTDLPRIQKY